ncbi:hypothetical protein Tco_0744779 [Tanacetum coccineum]
MSSDSASFEVTYTSISSHGDPLAWAMDLTHFARLVPGSVYPGYLHSDDEIVVEDQSYADDASPIALSPGYVVDSNPKEDSEDGPVYYPADRGDDDDDDDDYLFMIRRRRGGFERRSIWLRSDSVVCTCKTLIPSSEDDRVFRAAHYTISVWAEVVLALSLPSPPPIPLTPRASTEDILEAELPPRKRLCLTALTSRFKVGESSTTTARPTRGHKANYGFIEVVEEVAPTTLEGVNDRVTELAEETVLLWCIEGFSFSRGLGTVSRIEFGSSLGAAGIYDSHTDSGLSYRFTGVIDSDISCTYFISTGIVVSGYMTDSGTPG